MNTEPPPRIHPYECLTTPDGEQVEIDTEMVPLVHTLWATGLVTVACCQDIGESAAGHRDPERTTPSGHGGFVEYYRGYAWLKMPLNDGRRLLNRLLSTAFHDRLAIRWQPGSWRMHVPLVYGKSNRIDLAETAQLYFPREQVSELTAILTDLSADETGATDGKHPRGDTTRKDREKPSSAVMSMITGTDHGDHRTHHDPTVPSGLAKDSQSVAVCS